MTAHTSSQIISPFQSKNIFDDFQTHVLTILAHLQKEGALPEGIDTSKVTVEVPKDPTHGDLSTNAAMVLAKAAGKSPRDLAAKIMEHLEKVPGVTKVSIAGPGFINLSLSDAYWQAQLTAILQANTTYGDSSIGKDEPLNLEFVSANPTGPMHAGHGRGAVLGDVIAALLNKIGYNVTREYYINDAGGQTITLARSTYLRYLQAHGKIIDESAFEGLYPGEYLIDIAQDFYAEVGDQYVDQPESEWLDPIRDFTIEAIMKIIQGDLDALGVRMDVYTSEKELVARGGVDAAVTTLKAQDSLYEGVLEKPKGHDLEDWEERPQLLFRATNYGDDVDRPLQKSDGSWTYFAGDIAYHYDKYCRGFKTMIDILGADHVGYVKRIQAATRAITGNKGHCEVKTCQLVNFMENGQAIRMSKRSGNFITLRDVIDRVGKDATRFIMMTRHQDMLMDFDFAKVIEQSKDNPVFYVQYAHARCHSVMRHAKSVIENFEQECDLESADLTLLNDESELAVIKILAQFPQQVKIAALMREPHRLAHYSSDVAGAFHALWNKGKENTELRFIDTENKKLTFTRILLIKAIVIVLANCFNLFGVTPIEEMH